jgi:hypothetical protein
MLIGSLHKKMRALADNVNMAVLQTKRRVVCVGEDHNRSPCGRRGLELAEKLHRVASYSIQQNLIFAAASGRVCPSNSGRCEGEFDFADTIFSTDRPLACCF